MAPDHSVPETVRMVFLIAFSPPAPIFATAAIFDAPLMIDFAVLGRAWEDTVRVFKLEIRAGTVKTFVISSLSSFLGDILKPKLPGPKLSRD